MEEITQYIKENSNDNDMLFGDNSITPLVALFSERKLELNTLNTNEMIYQSGLVDLEETIKQIQKENVKFVITRPLYGIGAFQIFKDYLERECKLKKRWKKIASMRLLRPRRRALYNFGIWEFITMLLSLPILPRSI